jgi:hypothetical protein
VTAAVPELLIVKLWFIVAPSGTLPKSTAAGLALSTAAPEALDVSAAEATELTLALVTPAHPERISADIKSMHVRESVNAWGMGRAGRWVEM